MQAVIATQSMGYLYRETGRELTMAELARYTDGLRSTLGLPADVPDATVLDVAAESGLITVVNA